MKNNTKKYPKVLAISPSSRGLGFAVIEGKNTLFDWGGKEVKGKDKNAGCITKAEELILRHTPDVIVLEDTANKGSRRAPRIQELTEKLIAVAESHKVRVRLISRKQVIRAFIPDGRGTKHRVAEIIAARFPDELAFRLPPKRKAWKGEDARMDIFDAVALCLAFRMRKAR